MLNSRPMQPCKRFQGTKVVTQRLQVTRGSMRDGYRVHMLRVCSKSASAEESAQLAACRDHGSFAHRMLNSEPMV